MMMGGSIDGGAGNSYFLVLFIQCTFPTVMVVWQGVAMDSLKLHPSTPCGRSTPENGHKVVKGVGRPKGRRPVAIFKLFGHPTQYA
jgi:hypothetical protein